MSKKNPLSMPVQARIDVRLLASLLRHVQKDFVVNTKSRLVNIILAKYIDDNKIALFDDPAEAYQYLQDRCISYGSRRMTKDLMQALLHSPKSEMGEEIDDIANEVTATIIGEGKASR